VLAACATTFAGFLLLGGQAGDVLGRRTMFTTGVGLFTLAALVAATAPDVQVMIAAPRRAGNRRGHVGCIGLAGRDLRRRPARDRAVSWWAHSRWPRDTVVMPGLPIRDTTARRAAQVNWAV
jgi:hypothetical protein